METRLLTRDMEATRIPILWDATAPSLLDPVRHEFRTVTANITAVTWVVPFRAERNRPRWLNTIIVTGPSEVAAFPSVLDATEDHEDGMVMLEITAQRGDEAAFVEVASWIDWSWRPAADFARAVRLALAAGAHLLARNLADYGHRLYPYHQELAKMTHILAPPQVVRANLPPAPSVRANLEWMRANAGRYRGQWVALRNGVLLASAPTARELREQLPTIDGLFLTRVI